MNGVHDMGGMHGMGPIGYDKNPPVFHEPWEGRAWALVRAMGPWGRGRWRSTRYELEMLPPADYLRMPYYERWFTVLVNRLLRSNLVTPAELESGKPEPGAPRPTLPPAPESVPGQVAQVGSSRLDVRVSSRFRQRQRVRVRNIHPVGHTRLPRYVRGKQGTVLRDHGVWALQDTNVAGDPLGPKPQHVYTVKFDARELWGDTAPPRDSVYVDLWEDYLERP
jgi:nitrile hydratase subunit beta